MVNFHASHHVHQGLNDSGRLVRHPVNMERRKQNHWFLKEWRKHRGYTQDRLSEMTGVSKPYLSALENGNRQYNQELLEAFAIALSCSPADLLMRNPQDPDGIWSIWDTLDAPARTQVVEIAKTFKPRTGTDG